MATRQPVHAGQDRDVRLKARPERRAGHAVGQRGERALAAAPAAQPPQPMLEDQRRDRRQLPLLMNHGRAETLIALVEAVPAVATLRQVLKALVDTLGRCDLARLALVARLAAWLAQRRLRALARQRAALLARQRRITRRRQRAVRRIALQQPLVLIDALAQRRNLGQQPEHQHHRGLPARSRHPFCLLDAHKRKIPCARKESSRSRRPHLNAYAELNVVWP